MWSALWVPSSFVARQTCCSHWHVDLYGVVRVILDGEEEFGRVASGEVVVKEASREGHDAKDVFFC